MSNRITQKDLEYQVEIINRITNSPAVSYDMTCTGSGRANIGNYHLSSAYGGVNLHRMVNDGGGITCPLGGSYWTKRELYQKLDAFIAGLEVGQIVAKDSTFRIVELEEMKQEFILNESVFIDDHPSWGEVAEANAEAESKWDETDNGKELKSLLDQE